MREFWQVMEHPLVITMAWVVALMMLASLGLSLLAANRPAVSCPSARPIHQGQRCVEQPDPYAEPPAPTAAPR